MAIKHVLAVVPVADFDAARAWYEQLLGRPPDRLPNGSEAVWQLTETGLVYVVGDPDRAGRALLALAVDDLAGYLARLGERGISAGPVESAPGLPANATVTDPDGNVIKLFEAPGSAG